MMGWEATMGRFASRYQRLSVQDAGFLYLEHAGLPQHVAILAVVEGGPLHDQDGRLRLAAVREQFGCRLHLAPRLRQLVVCPPLGQGLPLWADDPAFGVEPLRPGLACRHLWSIGQPDQVRSSSTTSFSAGRTQ